MSRLMICSGCTLFVGAAPVHKRGFKKRGWGLRAAFLLPFQHTLLWLVPIGWTHLIQVISWEYGKEICKNMHTRAGPQSLEFPTHDPDHG